MQEPRMPGYQEPYPMGGSDPDPLPRQVIMADGEKLIELVAIELSENTDDFSRNRYVYRDKAKHILAGLDVYVKVTGEKPILEAMGEEYYSFQYIHISEIIKEVDNG